jgi:hypothetical protein
MPEEPMVRSSPTRSGGADSISSPASSSSDEDDPGAPAMAMAAAEEQVMREERAMEIGGGATSPTTVFAVFGVPLPQPGAEGCHGSEDEADEWAQIFAFFMWAELCGQRFLIQRSVWAQTHCILFVGGILLDESSCTR